MIFEQYSIRRSLMEVERAARSQRSELEIAPTKKGPLWVCVGVWRREYVDTEVDEGLEKVLLEGGMA